MNYVKIIRSHIDNLEFAANSFFQGIDERGHRVMHSSVHYINGEVCMFILVNDQPHPHKK